MTDAQHERYLRQIIIDDIQEEGQEKLLRSSILIIGAGGLGSPTLYYTACAGIGKIGIVDFDTVSLSNLNRQILHTPADIGRKKVDSAYDKLQAMCPETEFVCYDEKLTEQNIAQILKGYDAVCDCVDNIPTRRTVNKACCELGIPVIESGVAGYEGYLLSILPGKTPCFHCVYPEDPEIETPIPILGATAGALGCMQALTCIRLLCGQEPEPGLHTFSFLDMSAETIALKRNPDCPICGHIHAK